MKLSLAQINQLKEADILLFKAPPFPKLGWWVSKYTNSLYSHVGLVHFINNIPYCIEFKEFKGCRIYPLVDYIKEECEQIDVFRTVKYMTYEDHSYSFNYKVAKCITQDAKNFIGKKYGWNLIFMLIRVYIPIVRFFTPLHVLDIEHPRGFVCSTFISYLWRKHFVDPVSFLPDTFTKPSDIARSPIIQYMYTLSCEDK